MPKLTLDYNNYRIDLLQKFRRPYISTLEADKDYLFFNYIYSYSYNMILRYYLILFTYTQDFFYSFFSTIEDNFGEIRPSITKDNSRSSEVIQVNLTWLGILGFLSSISS